MESHRAKEERHLKAPGITESAKEKGRKNDLKY